MNSNILYSQLVESFENQGIWTPLNDDESCQLLAWLLEYGGGCEATTQNPILLAHIQSAQRKLNINGGQVPNVKLVPKLQTYYAEIKHFEANKKGKSESMPQWLSDIFKRYKIKYQ